VSDLRRFRGTLAGIGVLAALLGAAWVSGVWQDDIVPVADEPEAIFRFEKEDMVGFKIQRPDRVIEMSREDEVWTAVGHPWRPSSSMVRRVAHQLHDLTARATVIDNPDDFGLYGLGEGAIAVEISLRDGSTLAFEAGDPNPTSVSYYLRPTPGDRVYVVKKSAVDFYRSDLSQYREHKFATFDANEVDSLVAEVEGTTLAVERTGQYTWQMSSPVVQKASRDKVRMMLGRISAMKAQAFVEDGPSDFAKYGMDPPVATMAILTSTEGPVTMWIGAEIEGSDPAQRFAYRVEDNAIYAVKDGMLESYTLPVEDYRNRILLGKHEWDVVSMRVSLGGESIGVTRTADDWRWPDDQAIPGSTPKRVAGRAADVRAVGFHDVPPDDAGLEVPFGRVEMVFDDETTAAVTLGKGWDIEGDERPEKRQYVQIDGDRVVYEVDGQLASVIEDMHREYDRKVKRDGEKSLDLEAPTP